MLPIALRARSVRSQSVSRGLDACQAQPKVAEESPRLRRTPGPQAPTRPRPGPDPDPTRPRPGPDPAPTRPRPGPDPAKTRPRGRPGPGPADPAKSRRTPAEAGRSSAQLGPARPTCLLQQKMAFSGVWKAVQPFETTARHIPRLFLSPSRPHPSRLALNLERLAGRQPCHTPPRRVAYPGPAGAKSDAAGVLQACAC